MSREKHKQSSQQNQPVTGVEQKTELRQAREKKEPRQFRYAAKHNLAAHVWKELEKKNKEEIREQATQMVNILCALAELVPEVEMQLGPLIDRVRGQAGTERAGLFDGLSKILDQ